MLLREPDLTVPVAFLLQVHGVDYPTYELSMYSDVAILHTTAATKPLSLKPATSSSGEMIACCEETFKSRSFDKIFPYADEKMLYYFSRSR